MKLKKIGITYTFIAQNFIHSNFRLADGCTTLCHSGPDYIIRRTRSNRSTFASLSVGNYSQIRMAFLRIRSRLQGTDR